jgi:N-acetylmuramate 1-kinase
MNTMTVMIRLSTLVKEKIREIFSADASSLSLEALKEGGSDRAFYRLKKGADSVVLCLTGNREELEYYVEIGSFLRKMGLAIPYFLFSSLDEGVVLMEDVGSLSLHIKVADVENESETASLYSAVLEELVKLQSLDVSPCPLFLKRPFDYETLRWETSYFRENFLGRYLGGDFAPHELLDQEFHRLAEGLAALPFFPIHRDCQSQNVFLREKKPVFLDFQGARMGNISYDVAALLRDPYVNLPAGLQQALFRHYYDMVKKKGLVCEDYDSFYDTYLRISLQRLMQALGAYTFLSLVKGKKAFLSFIEPGLVQLERCLEEVRGFPELKGALLWARMTMKGSAFTGEAR